MSPTNPQSPLPFAQAFARCIADGFSGALDMRDEKRRWIFYFEGGELVGTKSNLKSDQLETLRAQKPDLDDQKLNLLVAIRRIKNALAVGSAPAEAAGAQPKERDETPAGLVLIKGIVSAVSEEEAEALAADALGRSLDLVGDLSRAGASGALLAALKQRQGPQTGADWVAGLPGRRTEALAVLWLATQLGLLRGAAAAAAPARASGGFDLGSLISAAVEDAAVEAPAAAPAAPFSGAGEGPAPALTIDEDEDEDDDPSESAAAAPAWDGGHESPLGIDKGAPSPEEAIHVEAISIDTRVETRTSDFTFPSFKARAPAPAAPAAPRHPLEDQLRALHARIDGAADHFAVLDLPWSASEEDFRRAHLDLARQLHPDRYTDADDALHDLATATFDKVRAAWEVLGDAEARQAYIDRVVHGKKTEDELAMEQVEAYWAAESEFKRGLALFNNGRIKEAHDQFQMAVDKVPDELEFRAYWSFTSFQQVKGQDGEKAEAFKDMLKEVLEKNKEQDRKLDGAWVLLGRMYRDLDNDAAARRCFVQALKLNPANGDANREMRRLSGQAPGQKKEEAKDEKKGFFGRLFGKK